MTGYAVTSCDSASGTLTIEIKSVNSRFLDLQFRINDDLRALEPGLREAIIGKVSRGKVECRVSFGRKTADANSLALNQTLLEQLHKLQSQVSQTFHDARPLSSGEILRWPGMIEEAQISQESLQQDANRTLATTLQAFVESRAREGAALEAMLLSRIAAMEAIVEKLAPIIPTVIAQFQQKAMDKMAEALGVTADGASLSRQEALERIRQEVTLYGIRIDLAEELSRLSAHLSETRAILKKGGQVGKRLDFMMQELNREANTLGSKAAAKDLADASMEMKLLIEQMREQVQNLE